MEKNQKYLQNYNGLFNQYSEELILQRAKELLEELGLYDGYIDDDWWRRGNDTLTINEGRSGALYIWYLDERSEGIINIKTGQCYLSRIIEDEEYIEKELA